MTSVLKTHDESFYLNRRCTAR